MGNASVEVQTGGKEAVHVTVGGKDIVLPVITGTEQEKAMDIAKLRDETGFITYDDGFKNTGSCMSAITFIDGDQGILRYRGIPIEEMCELSTFLESAYLIIFGELPTREQYQHWDELVRDHMPIHDNMRFQFQGFPAAAHPMAMLSAMVNTLGCYSPELSGDYEDEEHFTRAAAKLIASTATVATYSYKNGIGRPFNYPNHNLDYSSSFLSLMFSEPHREYKVNPTVSKALDLILLLHADHEQNCSTSTVRMVASSKANMFASASAGVCALWGPRHGGANMAVIEMLEEIHGAGLTTKQVVERAKDKNSGFRLMGFGHRVYKNYDPRAKILKAYCEKVLKELKVNDPLLQIAMDLEEAALKDSFFVERKLYPNVDFYSGIILKAIGIPVNMFTVMFAIGRMPGWIANWKEVNDNPKSVIYRPRQVYTGPARRPYVPLDKR